MLTGRIALLFVLGGPLVMAAQSRNVVLNNQAGGPHLQDRNASSDARYCRNQLQG